MILEDTFDIIIHQYFITFNFNVILLNKSLKFDKEIVIYENSIKKGIN